jgi:phosphonatase-like hydrolase
MTTTKLFLDKSFKLMVCDMAGTTVNEGGIVYKTLFNTIKGYDIYIKPEDMKNWYGVNKTEVLQHFINTDVEYRDNPAILPQMLNSFKKNLKQSYFEEGAIKLIHPDLPTSFNKLRENDIKVGLNTGYSVDIQEALLDALNMREFIDGYISSESVPHGRPEPYMINELMNRFNITDSSQVVKVGDTVADILEGKNAKCGKVVGVLSGAETKDKLLEAGADVILESVVDIKFGNYRN